MPPPIKKLDPIAAANLKKQQIAGKAAKYLALSEQIKPLDKEKKSLSGELKEFATAFGTKDEKGNFSLEVQGFEVGCVTPKQSIIDHAKALAVLKELNLVERCSMTVIDEKALEIAFQEGLIDIEQINSFTTEEDQPSRVSVKKV